MLVNLHVKDLAIIKGIDINFKEGLNIITGETGAGKSIIIGSITIALGAKVNKEMIREGADFAFVELVFEISNLVIKEYLLQFDIPIEENQIIISRKIMNGHSISKVNGVTVTLATLKLITSSLLDIHGQHEHQSLLNISKHLEILDEYVTDKISTIKIELSKQYKQTKQLQNELKKYEMDEEQRLREISFYEFEIDEINQAVLKEDEDTHLESDYKKYANARKIIEVLSKIRSTNIEEELGKTLKELNSVVDYDDILKEFYNQLLDVEYSFRDLSREISAYVDNIDYDANKITSLEERLNLINKLKNKYGKSIENILLHKQDSENKLEELLNFEKTKKALENDISNCQSILRKLAEELSEIRKEAALELEDNIKNSLKELNFNETDFKISFRALEEVCEHGIDSVEFLITTNPGEPLKQLSKVASGGELSRIMLAIKTILASKDQVETLIFDEIDTGISGRTAQKISEKLNYLGRQHQVICITHLAQIAAMADSHFVIEKKIIENKTITDIRKLNYQESVEELSRILGGMQITEAVKKNAMEMIDQAKKMKK